jgi:hypothetical protein
MQAPEHVDAVSPDAEPYRPASHSPEHKSVVIAAVDPYKPGSQYAQAPVPLVLYCPAAHIDAVAFVDPAGQLYPASHGPEHVASMTPADEP